ncbi:glucose-1-phosphate thymidylyltransferase [Streptomyces clavuligerus]|uniref:glucose-1-phosphate thymidylyltransferase n=1 Tax=Streptomyces clavuligerus TaxID=1901 RepID=UPI0004924E1D|nr:glucose-1-phosphate thymidylyltransferase [Streptomyces clavuligerus]ANW22691.1 glucose-1-phosphate thymidylyltransferase [Streptomyces clavuligerus]AXU17526.1 glucose-1-phosphate thymidylyltransferase [Streptomyces clavuligerus]AXU17554.1 glucose-1-phosphate thymidylyltransferase [Streptomyces clavuligerus]MBY6306946.1 glucose-1-phosphate thymidylyltransferase [Streptomyces clavuligerus]QCS10956.1 glucose-1-phosphate thymidylyltransferase [Streptomyces clavuligerus]
MKALVLAGGSGSRLWPITHTSAKQLVPVAGKPVLFYTLEAIAAAGIRETGVVVGDTAAEIESAVGDGSRFGLDVTYLPQRAPLGLAHAVRIARDYLGDADFLMYLGDNFLVDGVSAAVRRFRTHRPDAQIMLTRVADPRAFGVAELDPLGRVTGLEEKPERPRSDLALVGVYLFTPRVHDAVWGLKPSWRGELEITDAIQQMIDEGRRVDATIVSGYWKDTGNVADLLEVNRLVLDGIESDRPGEVHSSELIGRVVVEKGATVTGSRIVGPVVVAAGSLVRDSRIGPFTSIDRDCAVVDSEIEDSIVLRGATITGVRRVECSLIGREAEVLSRPRADGGQGAHRLVLGDHSTVRIAS